MQRNHIQFLRTLAVTAVAVAAVACADFTSPQGPAALRTGAAANGDSTGGDSAACDITVGGTIWRYSGAGDSASDTLGRLVPLAGARVELYYLAPLPVDSVPRDSVPRDSVPRDSVPRDSVPRDSVPNDTLFLRALAVSGAAQDTSHGGGGAGQQQPDGRATSRGDGSYSIDGLCPGIYRVEVHEPGTGRTISTWIIVRGDIPYLNFAFPPKR